MNVFGVTILKLERYMKSDRTALRLCHLMDLPALYSLFSPEILWWTTGGSQNSFRSFVSFWKWVTRVFDVVYLLEGSEGRDGRLIGFAGLYDLEIGQSVWVSLAIFNPDDRRQGFGRQGLDLLLHALQRNGVAATVYVEVLERNLSAVRFFRKEGFELHRQDEGRMVLKKELGKSEGV